MSMHPAASLPATALSPSNLVPAQRFHAVTLAVAAVAGVATYGTIALPLSAPAMFLGWIAYNVGAQTPRASAGNLLSFLIGLVLGIGTALAIARLAPALGLAATPVAVIGVVLIVMSLRGIAPVNNPLAYFLGLTSFFYSGLPPAAASFAALATAGVIGAGAAAIAGLLQALIQRGDVR